MLELRPYQKEAIQSTYDFWSNKIGINPVVVAPTGSGKSLLIAQICKDACEYDSHTRVLMLTHSSELIDQNFKELTMWFGNGKNIYRNSESKPSTDLEIYSNLQSLLYKMEACLAKSSLARDAHLKKHLAKLYSDNNQNKGSESSGPKNKGNYKSYANSSNDDDDFPY